MQLFQNLMLLELGEKLFMKKIKFGLASWKDEINGKTKYVFTSVESIFKSKSDKEKFDLLEN